MKALVTNGAAERLDQINYALGAVRNGQCSAADPAADLNTRFTRQNSVSGKADDPASPFRCHFHQLEELKRLYPHLKILISLEGDSRVFPRTRSLETEERLLPLVWTHSCAAILRPVSASRESSTESTSTGNLREKKTQPNFSDLLQEFRRQMNEVRAPACA